MRDTLHAFSSCRFVKEDQETTPQDGRIQASFISASPAPSPASVALASSAPSPYFTTE
jgi:hypothetical protein